MDLFELYLAVSVWRNRYVNPMKAWFTLTLLVSMSSYATPPNYYAIQDQQERLSYVDYQKLMDSCMKPAIQANLEAHSSAYLALAASCNKTLDQVKYPETFEGKIPGQDQLTSNRGIGAALYDALMK